MVHMLCTCSSSQWVSIFRGPSLFPAVLPYQCPLLLVLVALSCFYIENCLPQLMTYQILMHTILLAPRLNVYAYHC